MSRQGLAYAYFDRLGNLKEFISDPSVRQGNAGVNEICFYIDQEDFLPLVQISISYTLVSELNSELIMINSNPDFVITNIQKESITVPAYKDRDLKYFTAGKTYMMYHFDIPREVLEQSGSIATTIRLYKTLDDDSTSNIDETEVMALEVITFYVENSVIREDTDITRSQYEYLLSLINSKMNFQAGRGIDITPNPGEEASIISTKLDYEDVIINID